MTELDVKAIAAQMVPSLRREIWKSSATFSTIAAVVVFALYRSDFAALRTEIRNIKNTTSAAAPHMEQNINVHKGEGLLEEQTNRLLMEARANDVRRIGGGNRLAAGSADR